MFAPPVEKIPRRVAIAVGLALVLVWAGCETDTAKAPSKPLPTLGAAAPDSPRAIVEKRLQDLAAVQAQDIAKIYAHTPENLYPGAKALGWQLLFEVLDKPWQPVDFATAARHNPLFWQAAIELGPTDVSLPLLYASVAILGRDYVSASRILTLAQAAMPLTPTVRKIYATPESLLNYIGQLQVADIPSSEDIGTVEDCERYSVIVKARLGQEPGSIQLQSALVDLEARRAQLLLRAASPELVEGILSQPVMGRLQLTPELEKRLTTADPLLATALKATTKEWLAKSTLHQKWTLWSNYCEPADIRTVEDSIEYYTAAGRGDLAWMVWRGKRGMSRILAGNERARWTVWSATLVPPAADAVLLEASRRPTAGSGLVPIAPEGPSEAWSGDKQLHPLIAIKIERYIAMIDAILQSASRGSPEEGQLRISRAQQLAEVRAFAGAQREIDRAVQILGTPEKILSLQAALLSDEGKFAEADKLFERLRAIKSPTLLSEYRYGFHLYRRQDYPAARTQFHALADKAAWDASMAIMADLAARRSGTREVELLTRSASHALPGSWDEAGLNFLLGKMTEEKLIDATRRDSEFEMLQRQCEAYYWLAQVALGEQRQDDAVQWLQRCMNTGFAAYLEYWLARDELQRLAPEKVKDRGPQASDWTITT